MLILLKWVHFEVKKMGVISTIGQQIYHLQSSVQTMHSLLGQKEADLRRLKSARSKLLSDQEELHRRANTIQKPELPSNPWRGELAKVFQSFRQGELLSSYKEIGTIQLNNVLDRLEQEIITIEQSITNIERQIASTNSSISALKERRREELRNQ